MALIAHVAVVVAQYDNMMDIDNKVTDVINMELDRVFIIDHLIGNNSSLNTVANELRFTVHKLLLVCYVVL